MFNKLKSAYEGKKPLRVVLAGLWNSWSQSYDSELQP
jgi:hypothetical protein